MATTDRFDQILERMRAVVAEIRYPLVPHRSVGNSSMMDRFLNADIEGARTVNTGPYADALKRARLPKRDLV